MAYAIDSKITTKRTQLEVLMHKLDGNNPLKILSQGYFKLYDDKGLPTQIKQVESGDKITVLGEGGRINAEVLDVLRS